MSQGSIWQQGDLHGLDWQNVQSVAGPPGRAIGSNVAGGGGASEFDDDIAHLKTSYRVYPADQYAEGVVYRDAGYTPTFGHELELLVRFSITANDAHGYELLWDQSGVINLVRWNGALGDYTPVGSNFDIGQPADGDVLRVEIVGNGVTVKKNSSTVQTYTVTSIGGTVWATGQPGMGFWPRNDASVDRTRMGWKTWTAGSM